MNSDSPSLSVKILVAAFSFALMVAVPLLTGYYVAKAHAETEHSPTTVADHR